MSSKRYATIDIGTVTCRMLVADVDAAGIHELDREYAITNLGEGVDTTGFLKPCAMERVGRAIDEFMHVLERYGDSVCVKAVATSASRDAKNSAEFVDMLAGRGIRLSVLPGEREAALSFLGASGDFAGEGIAVVDIGGGSTEVVVGNAGRAPLFMHSFNIGCRRVTERFFDAETSRANDAPADPPSAAAMKKARVWIRKEMQPFFDDVRKLSQDGSSAGSQQAGLRQVGLQSANQQAADSPQAGLQPTDAQPADAQAGLQPESAQTAGFHLDRLVAVAGTATTVVSVRDYMAVYDSAKVHKQTVSVSDLKAVSDRLAALPLEQRKQVVGLDPGRAPVIVAGLIILREVCALAGVNSFTVSESDILHGIVLDAACG